MKMISTFLIFLIIGNVSFVANIDQIVMKIAINREVTLPCRLPMNQSHGVSVFWYKSNSEWLTSGTVVHKYSRNIKVNKPAPNEWNLFIKEAKMSFEDEYTCKTDRGQIISSYKLIIETPAKIVESESSPKRIKVKEGELVELRCVVEGKPKPKVKWYRGVSETPIGVSGHVLRIRNVSRYATDKYMCCALNYVGNAERRFHLTVNFAPEAEVKDSMVYIKQNEETVMSCVVQGSPLSYAYWIDNKGKRMTKSDKYQVKEEEAGDVIPVKFITIIFHKNMLGSYDYGYYTCVAADLVTESRAQVEVKGKIVVT